MRFKPLMERFQTKYMIAETGCWLWRGSKDPGGYGHLCIGGKKGKPVRASRISYQLHVGPIPDGLFVLHKCDVRLCVNPEHLFLGTHLDNMRDMWSKGRGQRGERNGLSKLTEAQVLLIRADTRLHREIAEDFGIKRSNISFIKARKTWRHIP